MRAPLLVRLAASLSMGLASTTSSAQSQSGPYPPAPYVQPGAYPPYPPYAPPPYAPPPYYVPPPQYVPPPSPRIKYQEGMAAPRGYHLEESPRKGLVISGAVVLGTTYVLSAMIGISSSTTDDRWLLLPVFLPFFDMAARGQHRCCSGTTAIDIACD